MATKTYVVVTLLLMAASLLICVSTASKPTETFVVMTRPLGRLPKKNIQADNRTITTFRKMKDEAGSQTPGPGTGGSQTPGPGTGGSQTGISSLGNPIDAGSSPPGQPVVAGRTSSVVQSPDNSGAGQTNTSSVQSAGVIDAKGDTGVVADTKVDTTGAAADTKADTVGAATDTKVDTGVTTDTKVDTGVAKDTKADTGVTTDTKVDTGVTTDTKVDTGVAKDTKGDTGAAKDAKGDTGAAKDTKGDTSKGQGNNADSVCKSLQDLTNISNPVRNNSVHPGFEWVRDFISCNSVLHSNASGIDACAQACWEDSQCHAFSLREQNECHIQKSGEGQDGSTFQQAPGVQTYIKVQGDASWEIDTGGFSPAEKYIEIKNAGLLNPGTVRSATSKAECSPLGCGAATVSGGAQPQWSLSDTSIAQKVSLVPKWGSTTYIKNPAVYCDPPGGVPGKVYLKNQQGQCWAAGEPCGPAHEHGQATWTAQGVCGPPECRQNIPNGTRSGDDCLTITCVPGYKLSNQECLPICPAVPNGKHVWDTGSSSCVLTCDSGFERVASPSGDTCLEKCPEGQKRDEKQACVFENQGQECDFGNGFTGTYYNGVCKKSGCKNPLQAISASGVCEWTNEGQSCVASADDLYVHRWKGGVCTKTDECAQGAVKDQNNNCIRPPPQGTCPASVPHPMDGYRPLKSLASKEAPGVPPQVFVGPENACAAFYKATPQSNMTNLRDYRIIVFGRDGSKKWLGVTGAGPKTFKLFDQEQVMKETWDDWKTFRIEGIAVTIEDGKVNDAVAYEEKTRAPAPDGEFAAADIVMMKSGVFDAARGISTLKTSAYGKTSYSKPVEEVRFKHSGGKLYVAVRASADGPWEYATNASDRTVMEAAGIPCDDLGNGEYGRGDFRAWVAAEGVLRKQLSAGAKLGMPQITAIRLKAVRLATQQDGVVALFGKETATELVVHAMMWDGTVKRYKGVLHTNRGFRFVDGDIHYTGLTRVCTGSDLVDAATGKCPA